MSVAALAIGLLVPTVTIAVLLVVHEAGHALVGWLLRFHVTSIEIGAGPTWRAFWIGRTIVILNRRPSHGFVRLVWQHRRWLRTRMVCVFASGPVTNVAAAVWMWSWGSGARTRANEVDLAAFALFTAALVALALAIPALLPFRWGHKGEVRSDALQILDVMRFDAAAVDRIVASSARTLQHEDFWTDFLRGRLDDAAAHRCESTEDPWVRLAWQANFSLLAFVREGIAAAMVHQREAERLVAQIDALPVGGPDPASHSASVHHAHRSLEVNRAFFLAHSPERADIDEAMALADRWQSKGVPATPLQVAQVRTRGLVLLHAGRVGAGIAESRRALQSCEPFWLRSLGLSYLAYGHALRADRVRARRFVRKARRLAPRNPLLAVRLRLIEAALEGASERAPAVVIR